MSNLEQRIEELEKRMTAVEGQVQTQSKKIVIRMPSNPIKIDLEHQQSLLDKILLSGHNIV
jgi:uncharacterized coiled-coil protein SlyX